MKQELWQNIIIQISPFLILLFVNIFNTDCKNKTGKWFLYTNFYANI